MPRINRISQQAGMSRFELGQIVATPGAIETMERRSIAPPQLLARHVLGDWGDFGDEDRCENDFSVAHGLRILSAYGVQDDPDRLWVITEGGIAASRSYVRRNTDMGTENRSVPP